MSNGLQSVIMPTITTETLVAGPTVDDYFIHAQLLCYTKPLKDRKYLLASFPAAESMTEALEQPAVLLLLNPNDASSMVFGVVSVQGLADL